MIYPNPSVLGRGIKVLREKGIQTEVGLLEQSARALNRPYVEQFAARAEQNEKEVLPKVLKISLAN